MKRYTALICVFIAVILGGLSCSSGSGNPLSPSTDTPQKFELNSTKGKSATHLWGYYDVYIDKNTGGVESVENRSAMFCANVVKFINSSVAGLGFKINEIIAGSGYTDVDIDVAIRHPFPGLPQYNGYDVRGVFMGDGSGALDYNGDLNYPVLGIDQFMLPDPDDGYGGADGYTRWYNESEFSSGGMPLFSYTPGKFATPGFNPTATLCPYKYFANNLGANEDMWDFLYGNADQHGVFTSGEVNTRNYYLRFPSSKGVKYSYAIIANWEGVEPEFHPSNAPEPIACIVFDNSTVYYSSPSENGGSIVADIDLYAWKNQPSKIFIESNVLSSPAEFDSSSIATGGGENYSTYHVDIPADSIEGSSGNEFWVIAQCDGTDYSNPYNVPNDAENDPLSGFFRFDLKTGTEPGNQPPVCDLVVVTEMPASGWNEVPVEFDASGSYDPEGTALTFEWDFDGDGNYSESPDDDYTGDPDNPTHIYSEDYFGFVNLWLTDGDGMVTVCSTDYLDVTLTNCPETDMPSGYPPFNYVPGSNSCRSGIAKAYGSGNKEYLIGHSRDYYNKQYGFYALDQTGAVVQNYLSPPQPDYPPTLQGMACTSTNRIYVITYSQYIYYNYILYYVDFDETTGFSGLLQQASMPSISPWYYVKITVDENDNPVALVGNGSQLAIRHWNGSSWT
ncbi:MAG: PKD domain-containing protein, partial [bacterium]